MTNREVIADRLESYLYWRGDRACALWLADCIIDDIAANRPTRFPETRRAWKRLRAAIADYRSLA